MMPVCRTRERLAQPANFTVFTKTWRFVRGQPLQDATDRYRVDLGTASVFIGQSRCFASIVGETKIGRV
jgi:hypothetical protein